MELDSVHWLLLGIVVFLSVWQVATAVDLRRAQADNEWLNEELNNARNARRPQPTQTGLPDEYF